MRTTEKVILAILILITIGGAIYKFLELRMIYRSEGKNWFRYRVRRRLLAPIYYFHSWECPRCGKLYFFSHNADVCCPGPHNEKWRREHPNKKCLTSWEDRPIVPKFTPQGWRSCPVCNGTGRINGVWCDECGGTGKWPG